MLRRTLIVVFLAALAVPVVASPCWACSCASSGDPAQDRRDAAQRADLIFTGIAKEVRVEENEPGDPYEGDEEMTARFRVRKTYKGHPGRWVTIVAGQTGSTCSYHFEKGERYTVFADEIRDRFHTNICSGTKKGGINPDRYGLASPDD